MIRSEYIWIFLLTFTLGCTRMPEDVQMAFEELPEEVDYNFHIKPILSDRCYSCHGPDAQKRKGDLRLDLEQEAFKALADGDHAWVPRSIAKSRAWQLIVSEDPKAMMPPPESKLHLSNHEKALIAKWIKDGAEYKSHWAFIPPSKAEMPKSYPSTWSYRNEVDHFILQKLMEQGLTPSPEADRSRLIRRLSFDLRGLPPSLEEIEDFEKDTSANAYEKLVDRFLSSDAHAERLAMEWLDVARYADSHGMHSDGLRIMWRWRDWAIQAFKRNIPYDDFIQWQIAGDLLLDATIEQKLATGFLRNQPLNGESGIVPEEYRLRYVEDRTNTTAKAFLGLTTECASCHDHKFDPISQKEFYELSAFFNSVHELGMIGTDLNFGPTLLLPDTLQKMEIDHLKESIKNLEDKQNKLASTFTISAAQSLTESQIRQRIPTPILEHPFDEISMIYGNNKRETHILDRNKKSVITGDFNTVDGIKGDAVHIDDDYDNIFFSGHKHFDQNNPFSATVWINVENTGTFQSIIGNMGDKNNSWRGWLFFIDTIGRPGLKLIHSFSHNYIHVVSSEKISFEKWKHLSFTYDGSGKAKGVKMYMDGKNLPLVVKFDRLYKDLQPVRNRNYTPHPEKPIRMGTGSKYLFSETDDGVFQGKLDELKLYADELTAIEVEYLFHEDKGEKYEVNPNSTRDHYLRRLDPDYHTCNQELYTKRKALLEVTSEVEEVMVMQEMASPRKTHILNRGQYDDLGEEVFPSTPKAFLPMSDQLPKNRLGLTEWLLDPEHPLTARVTVNRYWQIIFGRGLVDTPHDFGNQGSLPSHPELLDWLAVTFQESNWDLRKYLKMLVMSATYRQESIATEDQKSKDPDNIYLSRAPSYRLPIEMIRDNALAASGLLNYEIGGPSVKPYQPEGLWKEKNEFSGYLNNYVPDSGQDLYRRSMYTFIRRTSPPPILTIFDGPNRAFCTLKRERTNTPTQALLLLNDPQFVEAARVLAERIQKQVGDEIVDRLSYGFELVCGRKPRNTELDGLVHQYQEATKKFAKDEEAKHQLLSVGEHPVDHTLPSVETASLTLVLNTVFNFDEAYMKR